MQLIYVVFFRNFSFSTIQGKQCDGTTNLGVEYFLFQSTCCICTHPDRVLVSQAVGKYLAGESCGENTGDILVAAFHPYYCQPWEALYSHSNNNNKI